MHQYLFFIGDFPIRSLWCHVSISYHLWCLCCLCFIKKDGRGWHEHIIDFSITVAVAGLIGARLWDVFFFDWHYYGNHLLEIPLYGKEAWPFKAVSYLAPLRAIGTFVKTISTFGLLADLFAQH